MTRQTVHIVYSLPHTLFDKITIKLLKRLFFRKSCFTELSWPKPIRAPLSITYHLAEFFSQHYEVKLYDLRERIALEPNPGDILIGHPWVDPSSVLWRALDDDRYAKKFLISPYNHNPLQVAWFRTAVEKCDKYFAVSGSYWFTHFEQSPFADLAQKVVHVDMAIDSGDYPVLKKSFNPEGQRRFFYVGRYGRFGDEKGISLLERLAVTIPGFFGGYICEGGDITGWSKISDPTRFTPKFISDLAGSYDFFINMSRADAQATTVLEALSWGFPVACTRESGYMDESLFLLDIDDLAQNIATIERMQRLPVKELERISRVNRTLVETKYSWQQFATVLANHI